MTYEKLPDGAAEQLKSKGVKEVRIIGDLDDTGRKGARNNAINLGKRFTVKNLQLPEYLGHKADVCDLYLWDKAHFKANLESLPEVPEIVLPEVIITNRQLNDVVNEILSVLYRENAIAPTLFNGVQGLLQITTNKDGLPILVQVTPDALRVMLSDRMLFFSVTEKGGKLAINPSQIYVDSILAIKRDFPPINAVTEIPVVRQDGTILLSKVYDAATQLFYFPIHCIIPAIPECPTQEDVTKATALIQEAICDFPFADEASNANAIASIIEPFIEPMINDCRPLTLYDKPQQGTGATLLASVGTSIATGCASEPITPPVREEEWRKVIISCLIEGQKVGLIDNVTQTIASGSLASMITEKVKDRILGASKTVVDENHCCWRLTGNNIRLGSDLPRRSILVRLDAHSAEPWIGRTFKHPELKQWILAIRGSIISAILTLIRAWKLAGEPTDPDALVLGTFEKYCRTMSGILKVASIDGFLGNADQMYKDMDTDATEWAAFIEAWHTVIGERGVTVKELEDELAASQELKAAVPSDIADMGQKNYTKVLSRSLRDQKERTFVNGLVLVQEKGKAHGGYKKWLVVRQDFVTHQNRHEKSHGETECGANAERNFNSQKLDGTQTNSPSLSTDTKMVSQEFSDSPEPTYSEIPATPCDCGKIRWQPDGNGGFYCQACNAVYTAKDGD